MEIVSANSQLRKQNIYGRNSNNLVAEFDVNPVSVYGVIVKGRCGSAPPPPRGGLWRDLPIAGCVVTGGDGGV